jgi:uncharacterized protein (UPF0332 family)
MKLHLEKLIEKGKRSLEAARALHQRKDYDFAASRIYYSMLYLSQALLLTKGLHFSKDSEVIDAFGKHFIKGGVLPDKLGLWLFDAHESRNLADYGTEFSFTSEESELALDKAEEFLDEVEEYIELNFPESS